MKKFIKCSAVALTVAVVALYVSCNKTDDPTLSVTPSSDVVFEANGNSNIGSPNYTFVVETNQGEFTVTKSQEWVKVNQTATGFTLTAEAITSLDGPPPAKVTVSAGSATPVEIGVTQKGAGAFFNVTPEHRALVFSANGETCTIGTGTDVFDPVEFTVATNGGETWDAQADDDQDWLTVTKTATGFSLSATGHIELTGKETKVTVSTSGSSGDVVINVKQLPMPSFLSVNESEEQDVDVVLVAAGETKTFDVLTNYAGGWSVDPLANDVSWLTLTPSANSFTLTVAQNDYADVPDAVTVTVRAGEATSIRLHVTQAGKAGGSTRWAVTQQTWVVNSTDGQIKQVWSDYIAYDGKGKVAAGTIDDFIDSKTGNDNWPDGEGDYCRHAVTNKVPGTEGLDEKFKGYFYNYFYIRDNKDKICPSPWRVPHEEDFVALDLAFEGTGGNYCITVDGESPAEKLADVMGYDEAYDFVKGQVVNKYMKWGLQFGGMRNNTGVTWSYVQGIGYLAGQDEIAGFDDWFSTIKVGYVNEDGAVPSTVDGVDSWSDTWWIFTKHYGTSITSRGRERGWPVRCVRDGEQ